MLFIGGAILRSKLFWLFAAVSAVGAYGFHMGNQHGSYAAAYRAVAKELAETNKELTALKEEDEQKEKEQAARDAEADAEFAKAAPGLKKLVVDNKTADALKAVVKAANGGE